MNPKKLVIIFVHSFIGWVFCAATMGIGIVMTSLDNTLIIHVIGAPIFFAVVSMIYYSRFIEESKILFAFPRVMGLFLRSEAPGLVFSVTYPWGSFAPSAFSAYGGAAASPTDKSRKGRRSSTSHFRKPPRPSYF